MKSKRHRAILKAKGFRRTSDTLAEVCYKKTIEWNCDEFWLSTAQVFKLSRYLDRKGIGSFRKRMNKKVGTCRVHETTHYEGE